MGVLYYYYMMASGLNFILQTAQIKSQHCLFHRILIKITGVKYTKHVILGNTTVFMKYIILILC